MMKRIPPRVRFAALLTAIAMLSGCATTSVVPFTVQSDPLGAHVMYQVQNTAGGAAATDWIYLGVTPIDVRREIGRANLEENTAFVLRVVKDGYLEQQKSWSGDELADEIKDRGKVFWNPRLVPSSQ